MPHRSNNLSWTLALAALIGLPACLRERTPVQARPEPVLAGGRGGSQLRQRGEAGRPVLVLTSAVRKDLDAVPLPARPDTAGFGAEAPDEDGETESYETGTPQGRLPPALLKRLDDLTRHEGAWRVGRIEIKSRSVFHESESFLHHLLNALHTTTRPDVIAGELLTEPGDLFDADKIYETERNLRSLRYLADAEIRSTPQPDGTVDLEVLSTDRFTLRVGGDAKYVGGVARLRAHIGESNLFGRGKRLRLRYSQEDDDESVTLTYEDPRLFSSRWALDVSVIEGDRQRGVTAGIGHPFFSAEAPWMVQTRFRKRHQSADLYANGELAARVPGEVTEVELTGALSNRNRRNTQRIYLDLTARRNSRDSAEIFDPSFTPNVPDETDWLYAGLRGSLTRHGRFLKIRGLDGLDHVEDIPIGWSGELSVGGGRYVEADGDPRHPLVLGGSVFSIFQLHAQHLTSFQLRGTGWLRAGETPHLDAGAFLHHYYRGLKGQVLAFSAAGDIRTRDWGLPDQLLLGEDSGLRGYPARLFDGTRRLRFNLEDRIRTPWKILTAKVGIVAFFDAGLAWDEGETPDVSDLRTSAGLGLRFGSSRLSGKKIARLDVAFPLNPDQDGIASVSFSFSMGQIFSLFHNAEELEKDL